MENNQRNSRKRLNSLILLVAFTAVMLIVSTYAWFSTQKNVTLSGIEGKVKVAEGLQISLDASIWKNEIDFSEFTDGGNSESTTYFEKSGATLADPTNSGTKTNVIPGYLLPASTTGTETIGNGKTLNMYRGTQDSGYSLTNIAKVNEDETNADDTGYYAIDLYLQNSSATDADDVLQLEANSTISIDTNKAETGLQNTIRVALAITDLDVVVDGVNGQTQILTSATQKNISNVAIWEPNANIHSTYVQKNQRIATAYTAASEDNPAKYTWGNYIGADEKHNTYALNSSAASTEPTGSNVVDNVYYWAEGNNKVSETKTLQTESAGINEAKKFIGASNGTEVKIKANQYVKARLYIWLEGQDVDCINQASYGGQVKIDFGFSKPGTQTSE